MYVNSSTCSAASGVSLFGPLFYQAQSFAYKTTMKRPVPDEMIEVRGRALSVCLREFAHQHLCRHCSAWCMGVQILTSDNETEQSDDSDPTQSEDEPPSKRLKSVARSMCRCVCCEFPCRLACSVCRCRSDVVP